jgi:hypothetical protein
VEESYFLPNGPGNVQLTRQREAQFGRNSRHPDQTAPKMTRTPAEIS